MVGHFGVHVSAVDFRVSRLQAIEKARQPPTKDVRQTVDEEEEVKPRGERHSTLITTNVDDGATLDGVVTVGGGGGGGCYVPGGGSVDVVVVVVVVAVSVVAVVAEIHQEEIGINGGVNMRFYRQLHLVGGGGKKKGNGVRWVNWLP